MKEQFTKGPWFNIGNGYVQTSTFETIMMPGNSSSEIEANARLIEKSPEMFEALKRAYNSLEDRYQQGLLCVADEDLFHTITSLIGKVRGQE